MSGICQLLVAATDSISKTVAFRDRRFFLERSVTMQPRHKVVENFWIPISTVVWSIYTRKALCLYCCFRFSVKFHSNNNFLSIESSVHGARDRI